MRKESKSLGSTSSAASKSSKYLAPHEPEIFRTAARHETRTPSLPTRADSFLHSSTNRDRPFNRTTCSANFGSLHNLEGCKRVEIIFALVSAIWHIDRSWVTWELGRLNESCVQEIITEKQFVCIWPSHVRRFCSWWGDWHLTLQICWPREAKVKKPHQWPSNRQTKIMTSNLEDSGLISNDAIFLHKMRYRPSYLLD